MIAALLVALTSFLGRSIAAHQPDECPPCSRPGSHGRRRDRDEGQRRRSRCRHTGVRRQNRSSPTGGGHRSVGIDRRVCRGAHGRAGRGWDAPRKVSSQPTHRWKKRGSNPRSPRGRGRTSGANIFKKIVGAEGISQADRLVRCELDQPSRNLPPPPSVFQYRRACCSACSAAGAGRF